jgi:ADP-heptose:LPS heptosyltransferase
MNVDSMRAIDYYVGVPLCFLATWIFRIIALLHPKRKRNIENVLLIELSEMGSAVVCDPALRKLKANGKNLFFLIFKKNAPSLRLIGTVPSKNVFMMRENGLIALAVDTLKFFVWARKNKIDSCIDLELFSRFTALLSGFCGADRIVGFYKFHNEGLYRGEMLTHRVAYNPHQHIAKNFIALVNTLLSTLPEHPYSKTVVGDEEIKLTKAAVSEESKQKVRAVLDSVYPNSSGMKLILMNTGGGEFIPQRRWPPEYYVTLIQQVLAAAPKALVVLTGGPWEAPEVERISSQVKDDRCINFSGKIKFEELPALYTLSECMLTNDSGPAHFSSVTDMRTYIFYGPETPALYGPLGNALPIYSNMSCSPCVSATNHRKTSCRDNQCLKIIKPDSIFNLLRPHISG